MGNKDGESGMIMIEAVYVVVIAIMIIFFSVNVAAIYHNRIVATAIANEAASGIAEIYGSTGKEPFYAYTNPDHFTGNIYRYLFDGIGTLRERAQKKGKWYAAYLLFRSEYDTEQARDFSDIIVTCEKNGLGIETVNVTVNRSYKVFIVNPVSFFGLDPEYEVSVLGSAVCYDPIHQMNVISLKHEIVNAVDSSTPILRELDRLLELIKKIADFIKD